MPDESTTPQPSTSEPTPPPEPNPASNPFETPKFETVEKGLTGPWEKRDDS